MIYTNNSNLNYKTISLNFGPQHPAAHGVLRLVLSLKGETIINCDPHIGLLHRGTEKLLENKNFVQGMPYFDRLDYVSTLSQESVYTNSIDKLFNIKHNSYNNLIRTMFDELTRILNHLLAISCHALDVGSMTSVLWSFEERENIMEFYENISGARMHTALYKPIVFNKKVSKQLLLDILNFSNNSFITFNEIHNVLTFNKVWKTRLINIGIIRFTDICTNGLTGVIARSSGIKRDLRLNKYTTYNSYNKIQFSSYYSKFGDSYDRYILRMFELIESTLIVVKSAQQLKFFYKLKNKNYLLNNYMEGSINMFKYWGYGFSIKTNIISTYIESPKGELSITLVTDGSEKPFRCKIKSPSLNHLFFLKKLSRGLLLADLVTLIGTIDIVFGEIDR